MDWTAFVSTFVAIFVAEVGDKTQLATLSFAAGNRSPWVVFAAASLALVAASALAVLAGAGVGRLVSPIMLRRAAGVLFIALGIMYLVGRG
jgi:putative Ca2+/H+ antiporter (TMEM165/GDT1 family)